MLAKFRITDKREFFTLPVSVAVDVINRVVDDKDAVGIFDAEDIKVSSVVELGRRIRKSRLDKGLTQAALAEASGVSRKAVNELERGEGNPRIRTIIAISKTLNIRVAIE